MWWGEEEDLQLVGLVPEGRWAFSGWKDLRGRERRKYLKWTGKGIGIYRASVPQMKMLLFPPPTPNKQPIL